MGDDVQVGRLAMRQEGSNWCAYFARAETMDEAYFLGSIKMSLIIGKPERKEVFMGLMRECVSDLIEELSGTRPGWGGVEDAPEHERSGNA